MKHCILPAVLLCMTLLAGCTGRKVDLSNVTESTIGVNGDGSVEEVVIESFEKEYYSLSDLTAYVNKQVDAFNQANPQEQPKDKKSDDEEITAVSVHYVETDPDAKTAAMALGYLNMDIYDAFNETDFEFLSMEEAASDERIADIDGLVDVKSGEETTLKICPSISIFISFIQIVLCVFRPAVRLCTTVKMYLWWMIIQFRLRMIRQ